MTDAESLRLQGRRGEHAGERLSGPDGGELGQSECERESKQRESFEATGVEAGRREELGRRCGNIFAPGPNSNDWRRILADHPHLAPAVEPNVCRVPYGLDAWVDDSRADKLRCVGNGVVVLQAAIAFTVLLARAKLLAPH